MRSVKLSKNSLFVICFVLFISPTIWGQTCRDQSTAGTETENFDTLAASGASSTLPSGFALAESGISANNDGQYTANAGTSSIGDTYSYGTGTNAERALGSVASGSFQSIYGGCIRNISGGAFNSVNISYTGEQWRNSASASIHSLIFEYSTNATSLTTGTWTAVPTLTFNSPQTGGSAGSLNGNDAANRTMLNSVIAVSIPNNTSFYFRWRDEDETGSDHGLAADDFSITTATVTAGEVFVGGRVLDTRGNPIPNATVIITGGPLSQPRFAFSSGFGFFGFNNVTVGNTYVISVMASGFSFEQPAQVVSLDNEQTGLIFTGERFFAATGRKGR